MKCTYCGGDTEGKELKIDAVQNIYTPYCKACDKYYYSFYDKGMQAEDFFTADFIVKKYKLNQVQ